MASLLSQKRSTGSRILETTLNSVMNFFIQITYFAASDAAIYSDYIVESITVSCFKLFQLTTPPFKEKTNPDCDLE